MPLYFHIIMQHINPDIFRTMKPFNFIFGRIQANKQTNKNQTECILPQSLGLKALFWVQFDPKCGAPILKIHNSKFKPRNYVYKPLCKQENYTLRQLCSKFEPEIPYINFPKLLATCSKVGQFFKISQFWFILQATNP